ncbi:hypothetical protein ACIQWI_20620 [Peribacillus frigoritolerans]
MYKLLEKLRQMGVGKRTFHQKKFPNLLPQSNTFNSMGMVPSEFYTELIGASVRDSCGESVSRGDPAGASRGGSATARGKRVPGAEINLQTVQAIRKAEANGSRKTYLSSKEVPESFAPKQHLQLHGDGSI